MAYDWNSESSREPQSQIAELVPEGTHQLTIAKVMTVNKHGEPYLDQNNNRQILIIFADDQAREASQMFTLDGQNAYHFARLCRAVRMDMQRMQAAGVEPGHFSNQEFADAQLTARQRTLTAEVKHNKNGNKTYANVYPVVPQPGAAAPQQQAPAPARQPAAKPAPQMAPAAAGSDGIPF